MAARTLLAVLLFIGAGLTGCISSDDPQDEGPAVNKTSGLNTEVPDGRGKIIAFEETNQTEAGAGGVDHHHDQWVGRTRVTVFEKDAMMEPFPDTSGAVATFRPPQGVYIYEGTASVEFTLSEPRRHACEGLLVQNGHYLCTDYTGDGAPAAPSAADPTGGPAGLKLRYKHASTSEWIDVGEITWGTPSVIQITDPKQTDMPHATSSIWEFQVVSPNPHDASLVFKAKAEMVRGEGEIPLWPGHPLFYDENRTSRVVVENVDAEACDGATGCTLAAEAGPVFASKLVSYGTRSLFIWANISSVTAPNPATAPNSWYIYHRNATGQDNITSPFDTVNYGMDKKELFWVIPVDDGGMDSPYADASRWNFQLGASWTTPNPAGPKYAFYGGLADFAAKYTLTVIASSIELPPEMYHMSCLDEQVYCPQPEGAAPSR